MKRRRDGDSPPARLRRLPLIVVVGRGYPVATTLRARLLGLALLDRARAGPGLVLPRCRSVHTFGMRFALDVAFLAEDGSVIAARKGVPPRRIVHEAGARAVLETPALD
jgi:uncharacterized protein